MSDWRVRWAVVAVGLWIGVGIAWLRDRPERELRAQWQADFDARHAEIMAKIRWRALEDGPVCQ